MTFRLAPVSGEDALDMVGSIRTAEILRGVRGRPGVDIQGLADIIQAVSELVADFPEIAEVDLNPVLATQDGATAVDVRFIVDFDQEDTRPPVYSQGRDPRRHEPDVQAEGDRRHRRLGLRGQDRQLGHEEPRQRGLRGRDLPDQPEGRDDPRQEGLQRHRRPAGRASTSRSSHPGQVRGRRDRAGRRQGHRGRGPHPVRLRRDRRGGAPAHARRRSRASTASASSGRTSTATTTCRRT